MNASATVQTQPRIEELLASGFSLRGEKFAKKEILLAVAFLGMRKSIATIDCDPQASLTRWSELRQDKMGVDSGIAHVQATGWKLPLFAAQRPARSSPAPLAGPLP